mgnify:CR=1 FL=1
MSAISVAYEIQAQIGLLSIPHERSTVSNSVTVSIGVATARCEPGMSPDAWIKQADEQLYLSKARGRNQITATKFAEQIMEPDDRRMYG